MPFSCKLVSNFARQSAAADGCHECWQLPKRAAERFPGGTSSLGSCLLNIPTVAHLMCNKSRQMCFVGLGLGLGIVGGGFRLLMVEGVSG